MAEPFTDHRSAALALINVAPLRSREGQFLGGIAFDETPLSPKQANWLSILLKRYGLPGMDGGDE